MSHADLVNELYWKLAKEVPGRKAGDLGQYSVNQDELIQAVTQRLLDQGYDEETATIEATEAVWNAD